MADLNPPVTGMTTGDVVSFLPLETIWADDRFDVSRTIEFDGSVGSYNPVAEGDILLPKVSPTFAAGRVTVARGLENQRALATSEVFVVRARHAVDARFLAYRLRAQDFLTEGVASWTGVAGLKRVSTDFVKGTSISPTAWNRRHEIVDFLDRECARIASAASVLDQLEVRTFELERDAADRCTAGPATARLGWVADIQTGITLNAQAADPAGVPYLRVANVLEDRIDLTDVRRITVNAATAQRHALRPGDVLMTEGGDIDKLGRGAVWRGELAPCMHQNHVFAVRPHLDRLDPDYLSIATRASPVRSYFERTASRITNIASTNATKLRAMPLHDPPLHEQEKRVAAYREACEWLDRLRRAATTTRALLSEQRETLITEAVTGRVDVTAMAQSPMAERARAAATPQPEACGRPEIHGQPRGAASASKIGR